MFPRQLQERNPISYEFFIFRYLQHKKVIESLFTEILKEWNWKPGRKGVRLFHFMPSTRKVSSKPTQKPCVKPFTVLISTVNYKLSYLSSSLDTTVGQVVQLLLVKPCNLLFWNSFLGRFCVWQRYTLCLDKRIFSKKAAAIVIWHVLNNVLL